MRSAGFFLARGTALLACVSMAVSKGMGAKGNNFFSYRVNDLNLVDRMRNSTAVVTPQCAKALVAIKPTSNTAARADLWSGRVIESYNIMIPYMMVSDPTPEGYAMTTLKATSTFTSLGNPEACRDFYLPGFHYCRIDVMGPAFRLGACVPKDCTGMDVMRAIPAVPAILNQLRFVCGTHHYPPNAGTYLMGALILLLGLAAAAGTVIDMMERRTMSLEPVKRNRGSVAVRVLRAFSVITGTEALMRPTRSDTFTVLDGVKSLSILWVVFGHTYVANLLIQWPADAERMVASADSSYRTRGFMQRWTSQMIPGAYLSVNIFLFITAFLATNHMLLHLQKLRAKRPQGWLRRFTMEVPAIFLHRLMRISPAYFFVMGVYIVIASTLITGTPFTYVKDDLANCVTYWWMNLLYIQNLREHNMLTLCYLPSWYVAVDMQLFIVLPILVVVGFYNRIAGIIACLALAAASMAMGYVEALAHDWSSVPPDRDLYSRYFDGFYVKPWYRAPCYLLGVIAGIVWVNWGDALKEVARDSKRRLQNRLCTALALAVASTLLGLTVYGFQVFVFTFPYTDYATQWKMASYISLAAPGFTLAVAIIIFVVFLGLDEGVMRAILTHRPLILFSRISFCVYLVHFGIMVVVMSSDTGSYHFSEARLIFDYVGYVASSVLLATLLHLLVERPFSNLWGMVVKTSKEEGKRPAAAAAGPVVDNIIKSPSAN